MVKASAKARPSRLATVDAEITPNEPNRRGRRNDLCRLGTIIGSGDANVGQPFQANVKLESLTYLIDVIVVSLILSRQRKKGRQTREQGQAKLQAPNEPNSRLGAVRPFLRNEANFVLKGWWLMSNVRSSRTEIGSRSPLPVFARASHATSEDAWDGPKRTELACRRNDLWLISETVRQWRAQVGQPFLAGVGVESPTYVIDATVVIHTPERRRLFRNGRTEIAKNVK